MPTDRIQLDLNQNKSPRFYPAYFGDLHDLFYLQSDTRQAGCTYLFGHPKWRYREAEVLCYVHTELGQELRKLDSWEKLPLTIQQKIERYYWGIAACYRCLTKDLVVEFTHNVSQLAFVKDIQISMKGSENGKLSVEPPEAVVFRTYSNSVAGDWNLFFVDFVKSWLSDSEILREYLLAVITYPPELKNKYEKRSWETFVDHVLDRCDYPLDHRKMADSTFLWYSS